jgi:hypothetical protein
MPESFTASSAQPQTEDSPAGAASESGDAAKGPDALLEARNRVGEAWQYLVYLAAAEIDRFKLKIRKALMAAILGIMALVIALAILAAAAGILLWSIAGAIAALFGWPAWAGGLLTGFGILALVFTGTYFGLRAWQAASFRATKDRYKARRNALRARFGDPLEPPMDRGS